MAKWERCQPPVVAMLFVAEIRHAQSLEPLAGCDTSWWFSAALVNPHEYDPNALGHGWWQMLSPSGSRAALLYQPDGASRAGIDPPMLEHLRRKTMQRGANYLVVELAEPVKPLQAASRLDAYDLQAYRN